jgi:hypothetical protein
MASGRDRLWSTTRMLAKDFRDGEELPQQTGVGRPIRGRPVDRRAAR